MLGRLLIALILLTGSAQANPKKILLIGDSHVAGPFGKTLDSLLRTLEGTRVETYGVCGAIGSYFFDSTLTNCGYFYHQAEGDATSGLRNTKANAPNLPNLIADDRPDLVILELGSNYAKGYTYDFIVNDMKTTAEAAVKSGAQCLWVNMPDTRKYRKNQKRIIEATHDAIDSLCTFYDSTKVTRYPKYGGDGLHYEDNASMVHQAEQWAHLVFNEVKNDLE